MFRDKGVQFRVSVSYSLFLVRTRLCYLLHCPSRQLLRLYARPFTPGRPEETTNSADSSASHSHLLCLPTTPPSPDETDAPVIPRNYTSAMADTTNPPHPLLPPISTSIPPVVDSDEPILPSSSISTTSTRIDTPSSLSNAATHEPKRADGAAEKEGQSNEELPSVLVVDVEHFPVEDDPRLWSRRRKNMVLG